jgi:hypothetical protein
MNEEGKKRPPHEFPVARSVSRHMAAAQTRSLQQAPYLEDQIVPAASRENYYYKVQPYDRSAWPGVK